MSMGFIGELLDKRYKIVKKLGEGSFGETYLARDFKRPSKPLCVVKQLKPKHTHAKVLELFEQEAIILEKLGEHPQIPRLLAHFAINNDLYIIQDYIAGHTLRKEIVPKKQMPEANVTQMLHDILEVLVFVHQNNVIHRDIKPENIMRRKQDGKLVLIDFGSVKELGTISIDLYKMIRTSVVVGTPGYIPIEQAKGKPRLCSDIYALGMMAIEALTGTSPHLLQEDIETGKLLWRDYVQVSDALGKVLDTMICDRHTSRYVSATEALQALTSIPVLSFSTPSFSPLNPNPPAESQLHIDQSQLETIILSLEQFEFETATVDEQRWFSSTPTYDINRSRASTQCFTENLNNEVTLTMVSIPGGQFLMGSPDDELERFDTENPQHPVKIKPFFLSKFPITQAQWQAVAILPQIHRPLDPTPANFKGTNLPVEQVSWEDAVEFCARVSQQTKRNYRLPSEAEWEYACRAKTTTPFHFGDRLMPNLANYNNSDVYTDQGRYAQTTIVGSFPANAFGLYDMHGNVWEWCGDHWHESYESAPIDGIVWLSNDDFKYRVIRGGSWKNASRLCRCAYRSWNPQNGRGNILGFRVAISFSDF